MGIGKNIYEFRRQKKLTQSQLAEKLGVTEQSVSKWENDICAPDVSLFPALAKLFGVSIDRIFGFHLDTYDKDVNVIIKEAEEKTDGKRNEAACFYRKRSGYDLYPKLKGRGYLHFRQLREIAGLAARRAIRL